MLENTGQFLRFTIDDKPSSPHIIIEDGPLGFYHYRASYIVFHFGLRESQGSEHSVAGEKFPAEVFFLFIILNSSHLLSLMDTFC